MLFRQTRVGRHERTFEIIKLRTMSDARGPDGELLPDDQRLTRLGQFLRTTSIDELPQLLNVIRGDLSLVGPRPFLPIYLERYTQEERKRHDVMPGMTGFEVHELLRKIPHHQQTPTLFVSALSSAEAQVCALASESDAFLAKPYTLAVLGLKALQMIAQSRIARHEEN